MFEYTVPRPPQTTSALKFTADAYYHLIRALRLALPLPPKAGGTVTAADRLRDHAAIAALVRAYAVEAELAAQSVATSEQWKHYLRGGCRHGAG